MDDHQEASGGFWETELRILDSVGRDLPTGELGEIYLRSPMYEGYEYLGGAPPLRATEDGFHTAGDLGYLDDEGYLYLVDRRVDMIITGGANVFPRRSSALIDHLAIADVAVIDCATPSGAGGSTPSSSRPASVPAAEEVIARREESAGPHKVEDHRARRRLSEATKVSRGALIDARGRSTAPTSEPAGARAAEGQTEAPTRTLAEVAAHDAGEISSDSPGGRSRYEQGSARPSGGGSRNRTARGRSRWPR